MTKTLCDGCGDEIKAWKPEDPATGDGLARTLRISTGNNYEQWDLCEPCQGKVAGALVELLPGKPREGWWDAIRPARRASSPAKTLR